MKEYSDTRINVKSMSLRNYIILFWVVLIICGSYTGIYFLQVKHEDNGGFYAMLSMVGYLVFISVLLIILFSAFHTKYLLEPVHLLIDAAKRVTQGDFTVQLKSRRRDGKKDEFEILFEDFNIMVAELASTEILKKDFISNVSHEMKTPLSVIQNYATILQSSDLSEEERREYAERIGEASKRMSILITNILQMSRLENQKIRVQAKSFNLSEQLSRCALGFEQLWEEKDISLEADLDQSIVICSDEELLDIVWNNLLSNALKFTDQGKTVYITAIKQEQFAIITVEDTGCGMDKKSVEHIFDKFYQADTSHATAGNGLGLALVKQIITLLGGKIKVDSSPGIGSAFTIYLKLE
ncbi:HAMP domain-containing sensor histidine kinase [Konateibacter massiliensis]|uniref:HAMP domain-containing sensor histidine kinase n=1 Tax=Konateibacter massiliensis TaxID=2002841 RepID=UPI000C14B810|nr:HAMP domain-containing sensor histidine kinase [Konateibacter massiliensis]